MGDVVLWIEGWLCEIGVSKLDGVGVDLRLGDGIKDPKAAVVL